MAHPPRGLPRGVPARDPAWRHRRGLLCTWHPVPRARPRPSPPHHGVPSVTRASSPAHPRAPLLRAPVAPVALYAAPTCTQARPCRLTAADGTPRGPRAPRTAWRPPSAPARSTPARPRGLRPCLLRVHVAPRPRGGPACPTSQASPCLTYRPRISLCCRYRHPRRPPSRSTPCSLRHGIRRGPTARRGLAPGTPSLCGSPACLPCTRSLKCTRPGLPRAPHYL